MITTPKHQDSLNLPLLDKNLDVLQSKLLFFINLSPLFMNKDSTNLLNRDVKPIFMRASQSSQYIVGQKAKS